jgi:RecB family endonuclease NucS
MSVQTCSALLRDQPDALGEDLKIIAEEFGQWEDSRRRVDLLALDRRGRLVVIELKRGDDGSHMELQALRYAAMISTMTFDEVVEAYSRLQSQSDNATTSRRASGPPPVPRSRRDRRHRNRR